MPPLSTEMKPAKDSALPPLPVHSWPILTQQARIPWSWVLWIQFPWFVIIVVDQVNLNMMTFTLRKFVSAAWLITLLPSLNLFFNMCVGAACNYYSDRIWTRWGRRRPFLIVGHLAIFGLLMVVPFIRQFGALVAILCLFEMLRDVTTPLEPLEKEVVPTPQRGRGQAISQVARVLALLFVSMVLIGQFDAKYTLPGGWHINGEHVAYLITAVLTLGVVLFYLFGVREIRPPPMPLLEKEQSRVAGNGFQGILRFFRDVFGKRHNLALFALSITVTVFWTDLGNLMALLTTEQFGYSKKAFGWIIGAGQVFTLVLVLPFGGWIADRFDRIRLFQFCAAGMALHHIGFYVYARFLAPGGIPPIEALIVFKFLFTAFGSVGVITSTAVLFDFMATSQMGTISAGIGITRNLFEMLNRNMIGVWVTVYSAHFAAKGAMNYLSGFQYLILYSLAATGCALWFGWLARSGRLIPYGVIEQQERVARAQAAGISQ